MDDRFKTPQIDRYRNLLLPPHLFHPAEVEYIVTSPGFPPTHPLIQKGGAKVIGELDYFLSPTSPRRWNFGAQRNFPVDNRNIPKTSPHFSESRPPFQIWITGTNGKTTTTQMIATLLPEGEVGGNIGIPLGQLDPTAPIWILEVSSFQLHYTKTAAPDIFVILPITPDHLNWHRDYSHYLTAKLSPIPRIGERGVVIYPAQLEEEVRRRLPEAPPYLIPYTTPTQLANRFRLTPPHFPPPFDLDEVLARLVRKILYWDDPGLEQFQIAPHKVEEFRDSKNRLWVDDSKATNLDAVLGALHRYRNRPKIHLILGGVGKGQQFIPLFQQLASLPVQLYLIGEEGPRLLQLAEQFQIPASLTGDLARAVAEIDRNLQPGEVALLSPGCASFDQFQNYRDRGERFKELVRQLPS